MQTIYLTTEPAMDITDKSLEFHESVTSKSLWKLSIIGLWLLVATVFNVLVMVAYCGGRKKSLSTFLVVLAFMDVLNGLVLGMDYVARFDFVHKDVKWHYYLVRQSVVYCGGLTSAGLLLCVTIDRFIRIGKSQCGRLTRRKSVLMILSTFIVSVIVSAPFAVINMKTKITTRMDILEMAGVENDKVMIDMSDSAASTVLFRKSPHNNEMYNPSKGSYLGVFHIIVSLHFLLAFLCILVINIRLIFVVLHNGYRMSKHSRHRLGHTTPSINRSSTTPSDTDISLASQNSEPINRVEFKQRLSIVISHQAANLDPYINRKPSHILASLSSIKHRTPSRTFLMLLLATVLFLFNIPPLVINILDLVKPSVNIQLYETSELLFDFLHHSYIVCVLGNPLMYAFFNRGFWKNLKKMCCCKRKPRVMSQITKREPAVQVNGTASQLNPQVWYPTYNELISRTVKETAV